MTDDGSFGIQLSPSATYGSRFFTFQLRIGGVVVGDREPSIVWSAVNELSRLPELDDARLHGAATDPQRALAAVLTDETCNRALYQGAESLDQWLIAAYVHEGAAVWLARQFNRSDDNAQPVAVSVVDAVEFGDIAAAVRDYHRRVSGRERA